MQIVQEKIRKIIHIDMDCFYAAIEIRDNPSLANKPVAVGGSPEERSVLCTCNYIARQFGIRSAMSSAYAKRLCPQLIILPVNMKKYCEVSAHIQEIFYDYTSLVEPLSLDEAFLDVTQTNCCKGSATWMAAEIKKKIWEKVKLTASAGVAPNKFLAKIASGWKKPNGLFVITPPEINAFVKTLAVEELFGVGKVTAEKLHRIGLKTCGDIQKITLQELTQQFGKLGEQLYAQSHGIDNRAVEPNRMRKSLSVERTFSEDISLEVNQEVLLQELYQSLMERIHENAADRMIKNIYIKIKTTDFKLSTLAKTTANIDYQKFQDLVLDFSHRDKRLVRLLGLGVHFCDEKNADENFEFNVR